jgi:hypothetical protein
MLMSADGSISTFGALLTLSGLVPVATIMRRLLTGYAVSFDRRRHKSGRLFQNRYKLILCQNIRPAYDHEANNQIADVCGDGRLAVTILS